MKQFSIVALLTGMLVASTSHAQNSCFTSLSDYSFTGISAVRCIDKGDFNGDGHQDLVMAIYNTATSNQTAIFLGTGTGSFGPASLFTGTQRAQDLKAYDFNGDAKLDVVIVSNNLGKISICLGNGTGGFAAPVDYVVGSGPNGVDIGDVNEDGKVDLVVSNQNVPSGFDLLTGNGDGTFNPATSFTMGTAPRDVVLGDFNGDFHLDVATTNNSSSNISVRLGTGAGGFGSVTNFAVPASPVYIKRADINADSFQDLIVTSANSNTVTLLMGNGTGSFAAADNYSVSGPYEIMVDDYNEDGKKDVAVVGFSDNTIDLMTGTGINVAGSRLSAVSKFPVFGSPHTMMVGDYNEDSHSDLVVPAQSGTARFLVALGNGAGSFNTGSNIATGVGPNGIAYGEFNGNTNSDLVVANKTSNTITYFSGNGNGTYANGVSFASGTSPVSIYSVDVNHDGFTDVITANAGTHDISVFLGNGAGSFSAAVSYSSGGLIPSDLVCKDFNGDTHIDVAVCHEGSNDVGILMGSGTGTFGAPTMFSGVGTTVLKGIIADNFNTTDSFLDLAVANNGTNNITVFFGDGTGSFNTPTNFTTSTQPIALDSKDLNGDLKSDIVVACYSTSKASVLKATGTSSFLAFVNYNTDINPQSIVIADFNNDGKNDVATCNKVALGASGSVSVLMGNGAGVLGTAANFTVSNNSIGITAGTIDAGTLIDLAVVNFDANNVSILLNTTAVVTASGPTTFCSGSSVTLTSSTGTTYLWSPGSATTSSINATTSGTYHVTTSNLSGLCSSQSNDVVVTVNPLPSITSITGSTTICSSASTSLTAVASPGTANLSWYDAPTAGTLLSGTASYTTPVLMSTTTYYVAAVEPSTGCVMTPRYTVTVTVGDVAPPVISGMPSNITLNAGAACNAVATWTAPTATDECTLSSFTSTFSSGATFPYGTTTVTYTATDAAAHVTNASFTVTVNDVTNPTITGTPANISTNVAAGTCAKNVSWTAPTASDNCGISTFTPDHASGSSFPVGTTTVTYTATDVHGNVTTSSFTVTVTDNIMPVISGMPSNQTLSASVGTCGAVATWTAPTASDNCSIASLTPSSTSGSTFPVGVTTVTYTATDINGNIATATFTITVNDTQLPTISGMPSNITTNAAAGVCSANVSWTAPTASDNCAIATLTPSSASGSSFPVGTTTVTYTATDVHGNIATASFTITIVDNQNPTFTGFPSNIAISAAPGTCSNTATWTTPGTADNCGVASVTCTSTSGSSFSVGPPTTVTYTVTDVNGNVTNQSFTVTILDTEAPTIIGCPSTQTVCETDVVNFTDPTATDNCAGATVVQIAGLPSGSVFPIGTTLCTFRATDASGNITNCNFNIIVQANPTTTLNLPTTPICNDDLPVALTGGSPAGGVYSGTAVAGSSFDPVAAGVGTFVITYTFTNGSGCSDAATDSITVDNCMGLTELSNSRLINLYPNPTQGVFTVELVGAITMGQSIVIINNLGEMVYTGKLLVTGTTIDLNALSNGVYLVKISGSDFNSTTRLVIQK